MFILIIFVDSLMLLDTPKEKQGYAMCQAVSPTTY